MSKIGNTSETEIRVMFAQQKVVVGGKKKETNWRGIKLLF